MRARNIRGRVKGASGRSLRGRGTDFRGKELRIPPYPTEFTSRPWWPLVVRIEGPGTSLGLNSLLANLRSQLGFGTDVPVQVKLKSVRCWGPLVSFATGPLGLTSVAILDPIAENSFNSATAVPESRVLEQYTRYPDQVNRACIGFEYSLAHQSVSLGISLTGVAAEVSLLNLVGMGAGSVVYFYVLWRSGNLTPSNPTDAAAPEYDGDSDSEVEVVRLRRPRNLKG